MPRIVPTVGRVMWLRRNPEATEQAAIVASVSPSGNRVNCCVMDEFGNSFGMQDVAVRQAEDPPPFEPYVEWMPYQLGQAAKAEANK